MINRWQKYKYYVNKKQFGKNKYEERKFGFFPKRFIFIAMETTKTFSEAKRFKQLREELNFTQQGFAALLNIGTTTADIERSRTKISGSIVVELMEKFRINPLWLFGKSELKYLDFGNAETTPKVLTLDPDGQENIVLVNQKAAAGYPHNVQDVEWYQSLPRFNIPLPQFRNATYRGFQVEGDSMLPSIQPKDWVLAKSVASVEEAVNNRIYVVVLKDSVLVKKLQKVQNQPEKVRLLSLNKDYLPIDVFVRDIQELWMVNSKLTFGVDDPSESTLLRQLHASMEELKGQIESLKK